MAQLKCLSCGIQKEDEQSKAVCPMCGGEMIPVAEAEARVQSQDVIDAQATAEEVFNPLMMRATMYELALPALENWTKLHNVEKQLQNFLKAQTANLPGEIFQILWKPLAREISELYEAADRWNSKEAARLAQATSRFLSASENATSELGFSLITNSTASAAAYVGLSALDAKLSQGRAELAAAEKLKETLASISTYNGCPGLAEAIDRTVENLAEIYSEKERVQKYTDFYKNPAQNDVGVSMGGLNIFQVLSAIPNGIWGVLGTGDNLHLNDKNYVNVGAAILQIAGAGYIKVLNYGGPYYYVTTGKYEEMVLRNRAMQNDPQLRATEEKKKEEGYLCVEADLEQKKYYEAATAFARLDGYKDSMARSIQIWDKYLRYAFKSSSDNYLCADGTILGSGLATNGISTFKQIEFCDGAHIGLTHEGRIIVLRNAEKLEPLPLLATRKVSQIFCGHKTFAFVYKNGSVRCFGEEKAIHEGTVSQWRNISNIVFGFSERSLIGLRTDGTICVSGELKAYPEYNRWKNIKKILEYCGTVFGLTSDNKVYVAGKEADNYSSLTKRNDIIDIVNTHKIPSPVCGLTTSGTVVGPDSVRYYGDILNWYHGLRGVVAVKDTTALKADGTIISYDQEKQPGKRVVEYSAWKDVLALGDFQALRADGTILCEYAEKQSTVSSLKLFSHINTINEDRIRGIDMRIQDLEKEIENLRALTKGLKRVFSNQGQVNEKIRRLEGEIAELSKELSSSATGK